VIANGASITVYALAFTEGLMLATLVGQAGIKGAAVAVIANANGRVDCDIVGFVYVAITIIVDTIADLLHRHDSVAR